MNKPLIPDLNEITFEGRNKEYGAYQIRKKYSKYISFSLIFAIVIFLLLVLIPWLFYYFDSATDDGMEDYYAVEYSFIPPPEDISLMLHGAPPPPPAEEAPAPQVVDSVVEKPEPKKEVPVQPEEVQSDSVNDKGTGNGNDVNGEGDEGAIYTTLDVYPRYPGGDNARLMFLRSNIRYPETAKKSLVQGVVKIIFVVEPDGSMSKFQVLKGIGGGCDEEALRVAKLMPRWEPGRRNGKAVRVLISMPVVFRLPK